MGLLWYAEIILYGLGNKGSFLSNLVVAGAAVAAVVVSSLAIMSDFETWCSGTEKPDCHCQLV